MRSIEECITYLEEYVEICDMIIASYRGYHRKFEQEQKEAYLDCIKYLKSYKELKYKFSERFKDYSMDKYLEEEDDNN